MRETKLRPALFTISDPTAPRLCPALAKEIGLNESIILLQLEFWLRLSGTKQKDGRYWIYESITDFQETFPFWSRATINRAIHSLEEKGLILVGNFNQHAYDHTRWFTLNADGFQQLSSVVLREIPWLSRDDPSLCQNDTPLSQTDTRPTQKDTRSAQNETTVPDLSPDLSPEKDSADAEFPEESNFLPRGERQESTYRPTADPVGDMLNAHNTLPRRSWTEPEDAGGADPFEEAASAFCMVFDIAAEQLPQTQFAYISGLLRESSVVRDFEASASEVARAILTIPKDRHRSWHHFDVPKGAVWDGLLRSVLANQRSGISNGWSHDMTEPAPAARGWSGSL